MIKESDLTKEMDEARLGLLRSINASVNPENTAHLAEAFHALTMSKCAMEEVRMHAESHEHIDDDFDDFEGLN